jgi:hypothetical protein
MVDEKSSIRKKMKARRNFSHRDDALAHLIDWGFTELESRKPFNFPYDPNAAAGDPTSGILSQAKGRKVPFMVGQFGHPSILAPVTDSNHCR